MKKTSKYLLLLGMLFLLSLCAAMLLVIVIDPFFQYHKPLDGINYTIDNQLSQNPGIAKNFDYESVVLGSSMTNNFDTNLFYDTMGLQTVKLCYNGAYPKDIHNIMALVQDSPNKIEEVFLGVDIFTYKATPGMVAYAIPEYLYDRNPFNDVYYVFNKDVILDYIILPHPNTPINEMYWFWQGSTYGKESVLATYQAPTEVLPALSDDYYAENITENLESYILPYIRQMPDTKFTVFFPPYSVLYWYSRYADGSLEAEIQGQKQIIETLLQYPNVRVFYFQNDFDFITDFDNYSDYTHFSHEMNDYMTECFANGTNEITLSDYEETLDTMKEWLLNQDLSKYLGGSI
ncbi:MAG: hypothetical protein IJ282_11460 [Lachnospiraceae bacterium]|nr:hypothetical protein [Lachnospiraceae bacterium]